MTSYAELTGGMEAAYRSLWRAAWPLVRWYVRRKDRQRLVDAAAIEERCGAAQLPVAWEKSGADRPWTLWIHGASVGECLSALPVVDLVLARPHGFPIRRRTRVVMTTTTAAARKLLRRRLEDRGVDSAVCVFAPLDAPSSVARFYDTWRPDAGLWVESELWPTLILEAARRRTPIGLINARMSERSTTLWTLPLLRVFIKSVVSQFSLVLCQDAVNQSRFLRLGARTAGIATNLKFASPWHTSDPSQVNMLRERVACRPVWLAVSTHEGEEILMATSHKTVQRELPGRPKPLCVIIPRHPERTSSIIEQIQREDPALQLALRSGTELPSADTDIFIVDSLGETGLFFDAIDTVVMGGTFVPRGGHNPIEPLRSGCHVVLGPHTFNFTDIISQLMERDQIAPDRLLTDVASADELSNHLIQRLLVDCGRSDGTQRLMQELSVETLTTYERALVDWLARNE